MMTTSEKSILTEVLELDPEHFDPEDVYEFSNGKTFKSTDKTSSGVYDGN